MKIPETGLVVLKFGATFCAPCKTISPILKELEKENEGVDFIDIDIEKDQDLATQYNVRSVPHLVFIRDRQEQGTLTGLKTKQQIQERINLLYE